MLCVIAPAYIPSHIDRSSEFKCTYRDNKLLNKLKLTFPCKDVNNQIYADLLEYTLSWGQGRAIALFYLICGNQCVYFTSCQLLS